MKKLFIILALGFILPACSHQQTNVAESAVETDATFDWAAYGMNDSDTQEKAVLSQKDRLKK